jgi:hypothetical protein
MLLRWRSAAASCASTAAWTADSCRDASRARQGCGWRRRVCSDVGCRRCALCQLRMDDADPALRGVVGIARTAVCQMSPDGSRRWISLHSRMHRSEEHQSVLYSACNTLQHALISVSDLLCLEENSNLQRLQQRKEPLPALFQQRERWQSPVTPSCRLARWACSHASHAAAAE